MVYSMILIINIFIGLNCIGCTHAWSLEITSKGLNKKVLLFVVSEAISASFLIDHRLGNAALKIQILGHYAATKTNLVDYML